MFPWLIVFVFSKQHLQTQKYNELLALVCLPCSSSFLGGQRYVSRPNNGTGVSQRVLKQFRKEKNTLIYDINRMQVYILYPLECCLHHKMYYLLFILVLEDVLVLFLASSNIRQKFKK